MNSIIEYRNQFLGQHWKIINNTLINKADRWQSPNTDGNWTLSRDYLGADKVEFKNTSFLTYLHSPEGYSYDTTDLLQKADITTFIGKNAGSFIANYFTSDFWIYLETGSDNKVSKKQKTSVIARTCTPNNCSKFFWTKETVLSDKDYFTLKAYNVKH